MNRTYDNNYFWQGQKVRLRPIHSEDLELRYREAVDSEGFRLMNYGIELPTTPDMDKEFIEKFANCKQQNGLTIFSFETLDEQLVGGITLHSRDDKNGVFSFGLRTYRPFRGRGYGTEATWLLLRYGFYELRMQKAISGVIEGNIGSINLHKKLGFAEEGRQRRMVFTNGRYHDQLLYGMTREEFDAVPPPS